MLVVPRIQALLNTQAIINSSVRHRVSDDRRGPLRGSKCGGVDKQWQLLAAVVEPAKVHTLPKHPIAHCRGLDHPMHALAATLTIMHVLATTANRFSRHPGRRRQHSHATAGCSWWTSRRSLWNGLPEDPGVPRLLQTALGLATEARLDPLMLALLNTLSLLTASRQERVTFLPLNIIHSERHGGPVKAVLLANEMLDRTYVRSFRAAFGGVWFKMDAHTEGVGCMHGRCVTGVGPA